MATCPDCGRPSDDGVRCVECATGSSMGLLGSDQHSLADDIFGDAEQPRARPARAPRRNAHSAGARTVGDDTAAALGAPLAVETVAREPASDHPSGTGPPDPDPVPGLPPTPAPRDGEGGAGGPHGTSNRGLVAALLLPVLLIGGLFLILSRGGDDGGPAAQASPRPSSSVDATGGLIPPLEVVGTPDTTTDPSPTPTPTPTPSPSSNYPVALPSGARVCSQSSGQGDYARSASGNSGTSCPFAESVRKAYVAAGGGGATLEVTANSPVTGKDYRLRCQGDRPVVCTGLNGVDVLIFVFSSDAVVSKD